MAINLNELWAWVQKLISRVERLESGVMLEKASITNGRLRLIGGTLRIDSGGRLELEGTLVGQGTIDWTGRAIFRGPVEITDTLDVTAATTLRGLLDLLSDMRVKAGGKITIEGALPMVIGTTSAGRPGIAFPGGVLSSASDRIAIESGSAVVGAATTFAAMAFGPNAVQVTSGGIYLSGLPTTSSAVNVFYDNATGRLHRLTSAGKFKTAVRRSELPDTLLDVQVKDWVDAGEFTRAVDLEHAPRPLTEEQSKDWDALTIRRIPGVIAEEVHAAGGGLFNTYDSDGQVDGVMYDRLAVARTEVLSRKLDSALKRIDELESRLADADRRAVGD